jgi:hypothetical protein
MHQRINPAVVIGVFVTFWCFAVFAFAMLPLLGPSDLEDIQFSEAVIAIVSLASAVMILVGVGQVAAGHARSLWLERGFLAAGMIGVFSILAFLSVDAPGTVKVVFSMFIGAGTLGAFGGYIVHSGETAGI